MKSSSRQNRKSAVKAFLFVSLSFLSACDTWRFSAVAKVPNAGNISTKHKYRLKKYWAQDNGWFSNESLWTCMKIRHPDIFAEEGIPFSLTEANEYLGEPQYGISTYLCLFSCYVLPQLSTIDSMWSFGVRLGNEQEIEEKFRVFTRTDHALSCFSPFALACYGDAPQISHDGVLFYRILNATVNDANSNVERERLSELERLKAIESAIAYATASKLKELEDSGKIDVVLLKRKDSVPNDDVGRICQNIKHSEEKQVLQEISRYRIAVCERESGSDFAYRFELELMETDKRNLHTFRAVQQEFRTAIKSDYAESFPGVKQDSLVVDFPEYKLNNGKIEGRAVVLTISVASLSYDPNTRTGKLAVKVNANQYEEARKWIRKNIETLARDKNIALTTGEIPPAAKFYLGREELKDGNVLEIEFKTE